MSENGLASEQSSFKGVPTTTSLDPVNWGDFRVQAHRMLDDMLGAMEDLPQRPAWQVIPDNVRSRFYQGLPEEPTSLASVHEEFMTSILPFTARNAHPGFLGSVQGGGTPVGMLAEMLAAGLNANLGGRDQIHLQVEDQIYRVDALPVWISRVGNRALRDWHFHGKLSGCGGGT